MPFIKTESLQIFKIKEFRLFVLARFFHTLAIQMQFSTINLQIYYEYSKDEFLLGMLGLTEAVPFIITSFFSGHVADMLPKKRIMMISTLFLLLGALMLFLNAAPFAALLKDTGMMALYSIVFLLGIVRAFLSATTNAYLSQLVPRNYYTHSATWNSTAWHTGAILGPVVAGFVYGFHNRLNGTWCHAAEVFFFLLALMFIGRINNPGTPEVQEKKENVFESMKVGLNFVFKSRMVLSAISLDLFAVLFGGAVVLIPAFTDKVLHLGPEAYGLLRIAPAVGALVMAMIMAVYPPSKKAGLALLWSVIAFGLFTILFALCQNYWLAFIMLFCTGAFDNVSVVVRSSILQLMTPNNMRGRVGAINSIFIGSSNEVGAFESGLAAKLLGLVPSIVFGGFMTILTVVVINKKNPELKKLDINTLVE